MDHLNTRGAPGRGRIDLHPHRAVDDWTKELGVTADPFFKLVKELLGSAQAVRGKLGHQH